MDYKHNWLVELLPDHLELQRRLVEREDEGWTVFQILYVPPRSPHDETLMVVFRKPRS